VAEGFAAPTGMKPRERQLGRVAVLSAPGELLCADTFLVGALKGVGKVYLHAVVDIFGSYALRFLHVSKQPEAAVAVLHHDVLPFYRVLDLPVQAVLTDNGREFCASDAHSNELYLELNGIVHRRTKVRSLRTNSFVERFNSTVLDEFFRIKLRERPSTTRARRCRPISTPGSSTTTPSGPISATAIRAADRSTPSTVSSVKKGKRTPECHRY
jgi:transposase InsO family protein